MIVNRKHSKLQLQTSEISLFLARWIFPSVLLVVHILYWLVMLKHANFFTTNSFFLDFDNYRHLLTDALAGNNPYTVTYMSTLGPPHVMFVYIPFLLFPLHLAQFLFFLLNVAALYMAAWIVLRSLGKHRWRHLLLWSLVLLLPFPTRFSLLMGQPGGVSAMFIALLVTSSSALVQSISVVFLSSFKVLYLVILAALPLRRARIVVMGLLLLTIASFSIFIPQWYGTYITGSFVHTISAPTGSITLDYYNQSLRSTLTRFHVASLYPGAFLALAVLVVLVLVWTKDRALAVLLSLLVSPVIWQHYFVAVFPILLLFMVRARKSSLVVILGAIWMLLSVQFGSLHTASVTVGSALLASHFFIGLVGLCTYCVLLSPQAVRRLKAWQGIHVQFKTKSGQFSKS